MLFKKIFGNKGVLGINARNLLYIKPYNPKKAVKLADDKIKTKQFLATRGIPVPKLYHTIRSPEELEKFNFNLLPETFVLKPNRGFGGEGIIPIVAKNKNTWIGSNGRPYKKEELEDHIRDILDGRFSISNVGDHAFFEQYIVADESLGKYSYEGLPDIRVVVHNLIPVMAMLRLPTKESEGKANIHLGACAIGIDIARGEATNIAYKGKIIDELPGGLGKIRRLKIPHWDEILLIASKAQLITNLGYLAADICLDKNIGPVLLEINARAGLQVQVANLSPLRKRLERIEGLKVSTPEKGVRLAKEMFGITLEKEIANISGKQIISSEEEIELITKKGVLRLKAKVDTSKVRSIIDEETAEQNGLLDNPDEYDDEKGTVKLKFTLKNQRIPTVADLEKINKDYKFILGERDLKNFLIDVSAKNKGPKIITTNNKNENFKPLTNYSEIDKKLAEIDDKIKLLYHLRPVNLQSEKESFLKNPERNPQFEYPALKFDPLEIEDQLNKLKTDNSPLGNLFTRKKEEISKKISLLEAIDEERFSEISISLFSKPNEEEVNQSIQVLKNMKKEKETVAILYSAEETKKRFEQIFEKYGLNHWQIKLKKSMVADCIAGKNNRMFINENARFSNERIHKLIVHEIETHILTAENGKFQPYKILNLGAGDYLITQEGLAMYNVEKQRHIPFNQKKRIHALIIGITKAIKSSFLDTYQYLIKYGLSSEDSFRICLKAKRGFVDTSKPGAFTKDYIYYNGYKQIKNFVENGGEIKDLYLGKFNLEDLETIKRIPGIKAPQFLPTWLK